MNDQPPSKKRATGTVEFHSLVPRARVRKDYVLSCVRNGARQVRSKLGQVNLILVGDREMARLHRTYSNISGTTDVLTFDLAEGSGKVLEGDVYICLDQARRQAKHYRVPLYQEVARLAVHGVLHLAGFDDASDEQRLGMRRLEDRALAQGAAR